MERRWPEDYLFEDELALKLTARLPSSFLDSCCFDMTDFLLSATTYIIYLQGLRQSYSKDIMELLS